MYRSGRACDRSSGPPGKLAEVEDFLEFLLQKDEDERLREAALKHSPRPLPSTNQGGSGGLVPVTLLRRGRARIGEPALVSIMRGSHGYGVYRWINVRSGEAEPSG